MKKIIDFITKNSTAFIAGAIFGIIILSAAIIWLIAILKINHVI